MAAYYLDSSALVRRYVSESGSGWVVDVTNAGSGHLVYTAALTAPEVVAALVRKARGRELAPAAADRGVANLRLDWRSRFIVVAIDDSIVDGAVDIAEAHGLRGSDAVHVAAALGAQRERRAAALAPLTFVSADREQLRVALREALETDDPNQRR